MPPYHPYRVSLNNRSSTVRGHCPQVAVTDPLNENSTFGHVTIPVVITQTGLYRLPSPARSTSETNCHGILMHTQRLFVAAHVRWMGSVVSATVRGLWETER